MGRNLGEAPLHSHRCGGTERASRGGIHTRKEGKEEEGADRWDRLVSESERSGPPVGKTQRKGDGRALLGRLATGPRQD